MIKSSKEKENIGFLDDSIMGIGLINTPKMSKSQWFVYKSNRNELELLQLGKDSIKDSIMLRVLNNNGKFNYKNNNLIQGQNLKSIFDNLQTNKKIDKLYQDKNIIEITLK